MCNMMRKTNFDSKQTMNDLLVASVQDETAVEKGICARRRVCVMDDRTRIDA